MVSHNPKFISIDSLAAARKEIQNIACDPKSFDIMVPKAVFKVIKFEQIVLQDAIIMKQDMLSLGGEVAIPSDAFELKKRSANILVMGTVTQLRELVGKLNRHYLRIKRISTELASLLDKIN